MFFLYKREDPFGPKLLERFLNLLADILFKTVHNLLVFVQSQLVSFPTDYQVGRKKTR